MIHSRPKGRAHLTAQNGVNLDGGGSSTMYIQSMISQTVNKDGIVNQPRNNMVNGVEQRTVRKVANGLVIV